MSDKATFLFSGGGTGGHLFPGLAVAEEMTARSPDARCLFVGSNRAVEVQILNRSGFDHVGLPIKSTASIKRHPVQFTKHFWQSYRKAKRIIREQSPQAVIGLGGFASVPVVFAASRQGIPVILLEQNVIAGRATRLLCKRAQAVCLSFPAELAGLATNAVTRVTGNPVRKTVQELCQSPTPRDDKTLLIIGGSQGAKAVNEAVVEMVEELSELLKGWTITHQTGDQVRMWVKTRYRELKLNAQLEPFFDHLDQHYKVATLAISRAGATSLAELACAGCPTVLIPYPKSIKNHQLLNARFFEQAGAAMVVEQQQDETETAKQLTAVCRQLFNDATKRETMQKAMKGLAHPDAAARVADIIFETANK